MIRSSPLQLSTQRCRRIVIWLFAAVLLAPSWVVSAASVEVWYGPEDRPLEHLVRMYDRAQRYIFVAVYGLTSPLTVKALIEAKRRGVDVRVVTDRERLEDVKQQTALSTLREAGIPIKINRHESLMHLKQAVIDDEINTNGSMNQTTSGNRYNDERLDIIRDHALTVKAREKFLSLWNDHERFQEWKK
ncbi:MAG TPA: phospholipase D-like domain-containing protein [Nitrospira sp.]|nr:phospholipase D-like domain-containing protein [Nitrospira sp.]